MGLDDYVNAETGLVGAATAAAVSPRARELMRRGVVYGLAGAMRAGDVVAAAARGAVRGARENLANENGAAPASRPTARRRSSSSRSGTARRSTSSSSGTRRSSGGQGGSARASSAKSA